jgi:hypothetical protein
MAAVMVESDGTYLYVLECERDNKRSVVFDDASIECQVNAWNGERGDWTSLLVWHGCREVFNSNS